MSTAELIDLGYDSNFEDSMGLRTYKMIRPRCNTVKSGDIIVFQGCEGTPAWAAGECPHSPYYSTVEKTEISVNSEDMGDGRKKVVGHDTIISHEQKLNIEQVPLSIRVSNGRSVEIKRALGWKDPSEFGLKDFCQFSNCYSQKITHRTAYGDYCSDIHAKLIAADENEDKLEILDAKKRQRQLAQIAV